MASLGVNGSALDGVQSRCVPLYSPGNCTPSGKRNPKSHVDRLVFVAERLCDSEEKKSWLEKAEDIDWRSANDTT